MTASRKKQKVADPVPAAFAERLAELRQRAAEREPGWLALLAEVKKAAELSDESLHAEGRREAERRYGSASAAHFWPEPPSVALLIEQSARLALALPSRWSSHRDAARTEAAPHPSR